MSLLFGPMGRPRIERPEPLEHTSVRVPRSLLRRSRARVALDGGTLQDFIVEALRRELQRRERRAERRDARVQNR